MKTYFKGSRSPLSNFYSFDLFWNGIHFRSVEHAYQYMKLLHHNHVEAESILEAKDGFSAMKITRKLLPIHLILSTWTDNYKIALMHSLLKVKFQQCEAYRFAIHTGSDFVEDTNNLFWGKGNKNQQGENNLGKLHNYIKYVNRYHSQ